MLVLTHAQVLVGDVLKNILSSASLASLSPGNSKHNIICLDSSIKFVNQYFYSDQLVRLVLHYFVSSSLTPTPHLASFIIFSSISLTETEDWVDNDNVVETNINNSVNSGVDWFIRWFEGKSHVSIIFWTIFNILKSLHIILIRLLIILMLPLDGSRDVFNELYLDTWLYYYVDIVYEGYFSLWSIWILSFKYSPSQPLLKQWKLKSIKMCLTGWQETKLVISVSLLWRQCASLSKALIAVECQQFLIISKLSTLRQTQTFSTIFLDLCHQPDNHQY